MKSYNKETAVGIFVLLGLVAIVYMGIKLGNVTLFSDKYYTLHAEFTDVAGLKPNAPIQMFGVKIGFIKQISLNQENATARLQLMIDKNVALTDDAIASIKTSGLIGDKFVKITPGGVGVPLSDGETLFETEPALDIEALISKFAFGKV